jgi:xylan 1,4-beta-xylosidase
LLHRLGDERIANPAANLLVTRRKDGTLVLALWNLVDPDRQGQTLITMLDLKGIKPGTRVRIGRLDAQHGNILPAYAVMGKPRYPTQEQIAQLNRAARLPEPETVRWKGGQFKLNLAPSSLVILEIAN